MAIGLYGDLAVGDAPFAANVWARPELYARGASIGAPPDAYSDTGQEWGITPLNPLALREDRYRFYRGLLRRAFRHTGMLRIDHAMGLRRQFWVPTGQTAAHGAYVRYPEHDLFGLVALESRKALSLVVGEDLGVVPEGFREQMERGALLRSQVLYFERRHDGAFVTPSDYARQSLVTTSTHDLPPLVGFFAGEDLRVRRRAGNIANDGALARAHVDREHAKRELLDLLRREGLLTETQEADLAAVADAVHQLLAGGAPRLVGLALDDLTLELDSLNTPATQLADTPNWSRRLSMTVEELISDARIRASVRTASERAGGA
jgi:4-alpha-glucanotransferase